MLPVRARTESARARGVLAVHVATPQFAGPPWSKMREVKLPAAAYGVTRSQSRLNALPPTVKSLTMTTMLLATVKVTVAFWTPSTQNTKLVAFQSMR